MLTFHGTTKGSSFLAIEDSNDFVQDPIPYALAGNAQPRLPKSAPEFLNVCPACNGKREAHTYVQPCRQADPDKARIASERKLKAFQDYQNRKSAASAAAPEQKKKEKHTGRPGRSSASGLPGEDIADVPVSVARTDGAGNEVTRRLRSKTQVAPAAPEAAPAAPDVDVQPPAPPRRRLLVKTADPNHQPAPAT